MINLHASKKYTLVTFHAKIEPKKQNYKNCLDCLETQPLPPPPLPKLSPPLPRHHSPPSKASNIITIIRRVTPNAYIPPHPQAHSSLFPSVATKWGKRQGCTRLEKVEGKEKWSRRRLSAYLNTHTHSVSNLELEVGSTSCSQVAALHGSIYRFSLSSLPPSSSCSSR